jgi:hypothetical protein
MATRAAKLALRGKALSDTGTEIGIVNNADATAITIDSSENVGIGTSSPAVQNNGAGIVLDLANTGSASTTADNAELVVRSSSRYAALTFITPTDKASTINFGDTADSNIGIIQYNHANDAMSFTTNASEAMRIDSSGYVQIGNTQASHVGTSQLFINRALNAAPATSGTAQTGGALRLRGGDNAVLDMGLNSVNTWIQATDRANLANGYTLSLNPNGGNVGIGIASPTAKLHIEAPDNTDLIRFTVTGNEMWAFKGASATGSNDTVSFGIAGGTQAMAWDESGRVTKPLQPSFHARLNAAWTHPSGTVLVLGTWAVSTNENIGSCYDTSTRRFTAPVSGTYAFNCIVATGGGTGTFSYLSAELWVNGSRRRVGHWGGGGYSYGGTSGSYIAYLSAGDYAQLGCEANKTFSVQSGNSSHTQFSGHLVG